jgi:DNA-binding response OmpR family regulator
MMSAEPPSRRRVLLVEDDKELARAVETFLVGEGFELARVGSRAAARSWAENHETELVLLDWNLPDGRGVDLCPLFRAKGWPVLVLTARHGDEAEVESLRAGADDYLSKPVRPAVLAARLEALLRRRDTQESSTLSFGPLSFSKGSRTLRCGGQVVALTDAEYDLLWLLARYAGEPLSRDAIYRELRGIAYNGLDRSIDLRVMRIRKKLERHREGSGAAIRTVRGAGYMLVIPSPAEGVA